MLTARFTMRAHRSRSSRAVRLPGTFRRRGLRGRRAVSDVVATILILALTVTLFASIFAFVGSFPQPTPQAVNQFQANLVHGTNTITGVTITHLSGPILPTYDHVYLQSSKAVTDWQFSIGSGIPLPWGLGNTSAGWSIGQVWSTTFPHAIAMPDNITVYVVSSTQLLFSASLPGQVQNVPPAIDSAGITPANPGVGTPFQLWAFLGGNLTGATVTVNVGNIAGLSGSPSMVNYSGEWVYNATSGATKNGTYYAWITVTTPAGQQVSEQIQVVIGGYSVGLPSGLSVTVGVSPQPFSVSGSTPGNNLFPWATVTYSGAKTGLSVYVNFSVVEFQGGKGAAAHLTHTTITGPSGVTLSGPASVTVYSQTAFTTLLNTTSVIYANVSVPTVGTATGSGSFGPYNLVIGFTYFTSSSTGAYGSGNNVTTASHSCSSSTCPYLWLTVKNSWFTTLFGPSSLSFSGYVNVTCLKSTGGSCGTTTQSYSISGTVTGSTTTTSTAINVITDSTTGTTRWTPPTNGGVLNYDYTATMTLTITSGTTTVGYLYNTAPLDFTT